LTAGLGYDHVGRTDPAASGPGAANVEFPDLTGDAFGLRAGAGVRTLVTPTVILFADVCWHHAWTSPEAISFVPVRLGLRF
jgi:hypothetical protein